MQTYSDEELVAKHLKGDKKVFEILVTKYSKAIYNFVYWYVGDTEVAEDITQDAFVRAWRAIKKFDKNKKFKTWLFAIAKNAALDYLKKKKSLAFSELGQDEGGESIADTFVDPSPLPSELFENKNLAEVLNRALQKLNPLYRTVLVLYFYEHFNFREISEILGEPLNTVKSRQRRALEVLRKLLLQEVDFQGIR